MMKKNSFSEESAGDSKCTDHVSEEDARQSLRRRAEKMIQQALADAGEIPTEDVQDVIYELQVYQIELEIQNEELRRSQQELTLARDRYLDLYDFAPVGYVTLSEKGMILEANLTFTTMLDTERSRLIGQPFARFIVKEDQDIYYRHRRKLFRIREPQVYNVKMRREDNTWFWARVEAYVSTDSEGETVCRATISDITERKQAEEALQESERQFKLVTETITEVFWISTCGVGEMLYISPAYETLWQRSSESLYQSPESFLEAVHPDDLEDYLEVIDQYHRKGTAYDCEYRIVGDDGDIRWIHERGYPVADSLDTAPLMAGVCTDITVRKHAEQALREREALLNATGRMAKVGGWEVNVETSAVRWSEQTRRIHQVPEDYQPGLEDALTFFLPQDREKLTTAIQAAIEAGTPYDMELRFVTAQGEDLWVRTICQPEVVNGKTAKLTGTFQDITERKRAELQLQKHSDHLEELVEEKVRELDQEREQIIQLDKMAALGELATGVAHELNQPLASILFDADYLKAVVRKAAEKEVPFTNLVPPNELQKIGDNIVSDVARCNLIINHLRDLGRISKEPAAPINLNRTINEGFILFGARLRGHNVDVRLDLADDLPPIMAHSHKLEQVLLNLISNAEYALDQRAAEEPNYQKVLEITTMATEDEVIATVRDNGCGIPDGVRARIFDPFFTSKPLGKGTGLGLSISYNIVTSYSGEITCESVEGEGTTFTLRFPSLPASDHRT